MACTQLTNGNDISQKLFFKQRILIMRMLLKGEVDFQTLKRELQLTDGGLFSHLRALEQEGFVNYRKEFHGRRPATIYVLTLENKWSIVYLRTVEFF
jgi:DNA-binding HxlR family transcriptional regulator